MLEKDYVNTYIIGSKKCLYQTQVNIFSLKQKSFKHYLRYIT